MASLGMRFDQPNLEFHHWQHSNRLDRAWITSKLSEEALSLVIKLKAARDVWMAL